MPNVLELHICTKIGNTIRCNCGGQLAVGASLHGITDLGFGVVNGKFQVAAQYSEKTIGYTGYCMRCKTEGKFLFQEVYNALSK